MVLPQYNIPTSGSLNERGGLVDEAPFDSCLAGGRGGGCWVKRRGKKWPTEIWYCGLWFTWNMHAEQKKKKS